MWRRKVDFNDAFENAGNLVCVYKDSIQLINIKSGDLVRTISITPQADEDWSMKTRSKIVDNKFIYLSEDISYVTLDLFSGKIISEIKSPYGTRRGYVNNVPNGIIIERDKEKVIAFTPDYLDQDGYVTLWEKEFGELKYFQIYEEVMITYLNNHKIQIIDIHTGNTLDEFYELWTGGRRLSEDGILYQNGRYNFYSIKPNTEW